MSIYIGTNAFIESSSNPPGSFQQNYFKIGSFQYGGASIYETGFEQTIDPRNVYTLDTHTPGFIATSSSNPGWIAFGFNNYNKINNYNNTTLFNRGNHYSTFNTRFTAPITGPYHFTWTSYNYFSGSNGFIHPQFFVNGSSSSRRYNIPFRIRGHGYLNNYAVDTAMEEIIYLFSGDYVEVWAYGTSTSYNYPGWSMFSGFYVG